MKYPRTIRVLWIIVVLLWVGSALELKSLVLSRQWGSVPGPGLMTVSVGSQQFLVPPWIGYAYLFTSVGLMFFGLLFLVIIQNRKK
jgi:hypothetical protein